MDDLFKKFADGSVNVNADLLRSRNIYDHTFTHVLLVEVLKRQVVLEKRLDQQEIDADSITTEVGGIIDQLNDVIQKNFYNTMADLAKQSK